jgi:hypothetical protein
MTVRQLPSPKWTVPGTSGGVANGWLVYTYEPSSSTAKATFTTAEGDVENQNPVQLDSRGEATIFWDGIYKVVVKTNAGVLVWTEDNYGSGLVPVATNQFSLVPNYSFEDATEAVNVPDNWTITTYTGGTQTLDTSVGNQIHGAQALKFTSTGSGGGFAVSDFFPVEEAVAISVQVSIKSSVADVRNLIEILWYDRSQVSVSNSTLLDDSTTNPTSWTDKSYSSTPPANARFAKIRLTGCHSSDPTTGSTWFDNVVVDNGLVRLAATQTLTNKTLTSPSITTPVITSATGIGQSIVKRKTASETVTSSTTLQDDDHLTFAIAASEEWVAVAHISAGSALATTGVRVGFTAPSGATTLIGASFSGDTAGEAKATDGVAGSVIAFQPAASLLGEIVIHIWVLNSTNAGNVTIQFAQNSASGTAVGFIKGSSLVAHRIA